MQMRQTDDNCPSYDTGPRTSMFYDINRQPVLFLSRNEKKFVLFLSLNEKKLSVPELERWQERVAYFSGTLRVPDQPNGYLKLQ
jgi:hypothetical protein